MPGPFSLRTRDRADPALAEALAELERVACRRPELQQAAACHGALLRRLFWRTIDLPAPPISPESARDKLALGVPLLQNLDLDLSRARITARWLEVCRCFESSAPAAEVQALAAAVRGGKVRPESLAAELFRGRFGRDAAGQRRVQDGDEPPWQAGLREMGLDAPLAGNVLRLALFPLLARWSSRLAPLLAKHPWGHGYCPVCGSWPLLAERRGLVPQRHLRCGLCAAGWRIDRLQCPFCGTREAGRLGYLEVEGEEGQCRVETCDRCGGYVKSVPRLEPLSAPELLVADLATVHLDVLASSRASH